jgi:hypothetical protein
MEEKACFIPAIKRPWGWVKNDEEVKKMFRFRMSLTKKILFSSLAIILCFTLFMTWMAFGRKKQMYQDKVESIRIPVEVAFSLLNEYEARAQKGEFSREEAQKRAAERLRNFRYSGKEYIWINDLQPKMIMHPYKPEMEGKDLSDFKDPKGKKLFVEMVNICREKGGGLVEYMWPKHEGKEPVDKISYVMLFKPWGWVIGTGIYIDDLQQADESGLYDHFFGHCLDPGRQLGLFLLDQPFHRSAPDRGGLRNERSGRTGLFGGGSGGIGQPDLG